MKDDLSRNGLIPAGGRCCNWMACRSARDARCFKGPILRGLAGRGPYFHNGSAATLLDAVHFYDMRFELGLTDEQKADLAAFLRTL